jgi:hypothetical protein
MLAFAVSLLAILGFVLAFLHLDILTVSREAIGKARLGVMAILDDELSEKEKEAAVKLAGFALLKASFQILWRIIFCLMAAVVPIYFISEAGFISVDAVTALMLRWDYILATTILLGTIVWIFTHSRDKEAPKSAYTNVDQVVHRLAFSGHGLQLMAVDIEDRLFAKKIREIEDNPPIFITSLPRAGTTVLLTALYDIQTTASHIYRDMPFVLAPIIWSRISSAFIRKGVMAERSHGDGIKIGYDSPEAFEEVIWHTLYSGKYHEDFIELWGQQDEISDVTDFFNNHFRKIVSLRTGGAGRYLSKNNTNIARLRLLPEMFPHSQIVVPLREPAEHAASLLRQHENYLKQHAADPFVERYMRDTGHLEFGTLHKAIAFPNFDASRRSPLEPDYWLDYWIAAYQFVLGNVDRLHLVIHEKVSNQPERVMHALCERIGLSSAGIDFAKYFHPIPNKADEKMFDSANLAHASEIYQTLCKSGI